MPKPRSTCSLTLFLEHGCLGPSSELSFRETKSSSCWRVALLLFCTQSGEDTAPVTPDSSPSFLSLSSPYMNIVGQSCADTSYSPTAATPSFLPKSDFPQVGDSSSSSPSCPQCPSATHGCLLHLRSAPTASAEPHVMWKCGLFWGIAMPLGLASLNYSPTVLICQRQFHHSGEPGQRSCNKGWGLSPALLCSHPVCGWWGSLLELLLICFPQTSVPSSVSCAGPVFTLVPRGGPSVPVPPGTSGAHQVQTPQ